MITKEELLQVNVLTPHRLLQALHALIYWVQRTYFAEEINWLKKGDPLPRKSVLIHLYPVLDAHGHLRVGG